MARFSAGDRVEILPIITTHHAGSIGTVKIASYRSRERATLDKYLVEFENGQEAWFWSIQLRSHASEQHGFLQ